MKVFWSSVFTTIIYIKGAAPRCFGECYIVLTIIIHVIKILMEYIYQKHEDKWYIRGIKTLCVNSDSSHCWHYVSIWRDLNEAHAKTRNGKWYGMKKGTFIDKLRYVNLLDAITRVEIGKTIKFALYNISHDNSIIRSVFIPSFVLFSVLTNTPTFVSVYKFSPLFLPFRSLSGENN
jgi:hypothetical protein